MEAENSFKTAVSLEPLNIVYNYALAYLYYEKHDYTKAIDCIENTLRIDNNYTDAKILRAMISALNGKITDAKMQLQALKETETQNDFLYYAMAKVYKEIPMYKDAIEALQQALFIKPESLEYLSELADCYCEQEQYQTAQDILTKVLYLNNKFIYAHLLMAKINIRQKKYTIATKIISNAIKLDNSSAEAYKYQAMIFAAQGLKHRSIESAKIAVSLSPSDHKYYGYLAKLYYDAQEYANAFLYYKEASMLDELNIEYLYNAAKSADKDNDVINAINYYSYSLRQDPYNNLIIYEYVDLLKRNGKLKQALSLLKSKIDTVESENIAELLQTKYNELLTESKRPLSEKIKNLFRK
jgi:tetratricopeptide (TPR) repeat protein